MASVKSVNYDKIGFDELAHGQKNALCWKHKLQESKAELAHGQKMKFFGYFEKKFTSPKINLGQKKKKLLLWIFYRNLYLIFLTSNKVWAKIWEVFWTCHFVGEERNLGRHDIQHNDTQPNNVQHNNN